MDFLACFSHLRLVFYALISFGIAIARIEADA